METEEVKRAVDEYHSQLRLFGLKDFQAGGRWGSREGRWGSREGRWGSREGRWGSREGRWGSREVGREAGGGTRRGVWGEGLGQGAGAGAGALWDAAGEEIFLGVEGKGLLAQPLPQPLPQPPPQPLLRGPVVV